MKYKKTQGSFETYLSDIYYNTEQNDEKSVHELLTWFHAFPPMAQQPPIMPLLYIIDYSRQQYVLFSDTMSLVAGYHPKDFLDSGLELTRHVFRKEDYGIYSQHIFLANCNFLEKTPQAEHINHLFSFTYRLKNGKGKTQWMLQQGGYITSSVTGLPLYSLGICLDITNIKQDSRMIHTIEKISVETPLEKKAVLHNYYYPNEEDALFTPKEKEVLLYMADGFSTKEIAHRMHLSETTVITHRKNMMQKANAKNAIELVVYSIKQNII